MERANSIFSISRRYGMMVSKGGMVMRKIRCYECGKGYDYDEEGFCPRCGAFNQPPAMSRVDADGAVVRVDGINEQNHRESFVHRELHAEERQRRKYDLDKDERKIQKGAEKKARPRASAAGARKEITLASLIFKIIFAIIVLNFLSGFLALFF